MLGVNPENAAALAHEAASLGFIVHADDPSRRIIACPGKPACASGWIAARALAAELARRVMQSSSGKAGLLPPPLWEGVGTVRNFNGHPHPQPLPTRGRGARRACGTAEDPSEAIIHISGCAKGCAHPRAAAVTVVGTERGCGIVHHGSARAAPSYVIDPAHLVSKLEHVSSHTKEPVDA
jgi:precorrin-3B synthase